MNRDVYLEHLPDPARTLQVVHHREIDTAGDDVVRFYARFTCGARDECVRNRLRHVDSCGFIESPS
jgi:hypothetical protein